MISRLAFLKAWLLIWLIVVAGSLFLLAGKVSTVEANPPATGNALLSRIPSPTPSPACGPAWRVVDTPNSSLWNNDLADIALVSANDAWAVGHYQAIITPTVQTRALIEHWDGVSWSTVPAPLLQAESYELTGVDGSSRNEAWAVGSYSDPSTGTKAMTLRWNGTQWAILPGPPITGTQHLDNGLYSVSATSDNDVWAVGYYYVTDSEEKGFIRHWNGADWSDEVFTSSTRLKSVKGVSGNSAWAGGYRNEGTTSHAIVLQWDGSNWADLNVPVPANSYFNAVSASGPGDIWAVGQYYDGENKPLYVHWNGAHWQTVPPSDTYQYFVRDVLALSPTDAWIVGLGTIHWDGQLLSPVSSPSGMELYGVDALRSDEIWLAGWQFGAGSYQRTLVMRYNDPCAPPTPTPIPPRCPGERFTDVCPGDYYYTAVLALNDDAVISGYSTSPPCDNSQSIPCFKPYNSISRGQIAKIVSLAAGFNEPVRGQTYQDVLPGSTFYEYIERMSSRGIMYGYPAGDPGCPELPPPGQPCFYPNRFSTRGQLSKAIARTFQFNEPVSGQTFEDVPPSSIFYEYIERLASRSLIGGYPCGGSGEPCVPPNNRPYFRPNSYITRGQTAKIVQLARLLPTPTPTATATVTNTPLPIATATATGTPLSFVSSH